MASMYPSPQPGPKVQAFSETQPRRNSGIILKIISQCEAGFNLKASLTDIAVRYFGGPDRKENILDAPNFSGSPPISE